MLPVDGDQSGVRFAFGANWRRFLDVVDDDRVRQAEAGLADMLGADRIRGRSFLDIGCGSGLMSLAAVRLGSARVRSFDCDPAAVASAEQLRRRRAASTAGWTIERGDILDGGYVRALRRWDVVYSWGVLHHTERMWDAIENAASLVDDGGLLFIAIYNNQGIKSRYWRSVKRFFNAGPLQRRFVIGTHVPAFVARGFLGDVLRGRNPFRRYTAYRRARGMSWTHDWIDWLGGYPFETAAPPPVISALAARGFTLVRAVTRERTWGCNEYVFERSPTAHHSETRRT